ncbi:FoF1 ATP synthase subunit delta/epsilon [Phaeocystidibacter luteus]|uniref:F0F1 ATP synthase subunit epsilon n=1 Tax=Phaeocystidibacter luteus TaxID=911197 RepID=A0A6N6RJZ5_9FLAO|nr:F0F1 ATP synthase subunit epsilon [Phaeocystidibacter luteus]KAB2814070.1 F0F1 ATP synthase subunit epsilon [Phaeocystidibacter luteus]
MFLEIITPEKHIFQGEVDAVQLPGTDGLFQILNNHAPIIATLASGSVKVNLADNHKTLDNLSGEIIPDTSNDKVIRVEIKGGVVEMMNNNIILLAN